LEDLGWFLLRWFPAVLAPWFGLEWSFRWEDKAAFIREHASQGVLESFVPVDPAAVEMYLAGDALRYRAGIGAFTAKFFPIRDAMVGRVIDSIAHDVGFLTAERALLVRPELHWIVSRRPIGPGRGRPAEGVPVLEVEPQARSLSAHATWPFMAALILLTRSMVLPDSPAWDESNRWLLWDSYQMIVTGKPSSRAARSGA
jgi:hypothetical protein